MKAYVLILVVFVFHACHKAAVSPKEKGLKPLYAHSAVSAIDTGWQLIFSDEFTGAGSFDTAKWSHCGRNEADWGKYVTPAPAYAFQTGGNLVLRLDDAGIAGDTAHYHSGAIETTGKFSFTYGKVEVRAKFNQGQGAWPAIWMMPENPVSYGEWPNSGEIDIMEHLNYDNIVYQTVHNAAVTNDNGGSSAHDTAPYNTDGFNIYTLEWSPTALTFYVNGSLIYTYDKPDNATSKEWPFNKPFFIILNQAGGGAWPGNIDDDDLPFWMEVDYVRVYSTING